MMFKYLIIAHGAILFPEAEAYSRVAEFLNISAHPELGMQVVLDMFSIGPKGKYFFGGGSLFV